MFKYECAFPEQGKQKLQAADSFNTCKYFQTVIF